MKYLSALKDMDDRELLSGALASERLAADGYNRFSGQCATGAVREKFLTLLNEELKLQGDILQELDKRGWLPTTAANPQEVAQVKEQYQSMS